jgi:hypothetical protein
VSHLVQYAGRDPNGTIQHGIEPSNTLRFRDFTGWAALTFRDLDNHRVIDQPKTRTS